MTQQIPEFILHDFEPAYMQMYRRGELGERVDLMITASLRFYGELNGHLRRSFRQRRLNISCPEQNTVRNVIELLAVPATDVDLIIANGESVDFSYAVQQGDRISVYPLFRSIDISPLKKLHLLN